MYCSKYILVNYVISKASGQQETLSKALEKSGYILISDYAGGQHPKPPHVVKGSTVYQI